MVIQKKVWSNLLGLWVLLSVFSGIPAKATSAEAPMATNQVSQIEQPFELKLGITLGGLALIGLELWWFLVSKTQAQQATANQGIQELTIQVDGGYDPNRVVVKAGQPVRLNFFRKDPSSCLEKIILPDFHIAKDLDLNRMTPVEFTPKIPGEYAFTCGMNMARGVLEVKAAAMANQEE
ncbi:cupredoxin domain-containing protein [Coleofasciculus sp. FACHB-1120]|uniref:cupredoxin domain-containing protein n=1 Tax=Coleofasciculus sp. FACHB-1120 TaxID=2692783 RepID=UPI0016832EB2|nr:cupredoxin domain-containing protein [Coleofasciculus sp. FACHB-1120]MBD2744898.1 cupredoxin domain-containing protein [Coleofasciculus sp. FACHB-1120]